jgi:hypothetical protein
LRARIGGRGFTRMPRVYSNVCYYVVAHQDDWLLFYGQQAFADLQTPHTRVVFIYTTAGDAGESETWWRAREQGALAAEALPVGIAVPDPGVITVNGHRIALYDAGAFVSYHMRLPDGRPNGGGFPSTGHASLAKLQNGEIPQLTALDNSTTYVSWNDLCATLRAVIERERSGAPNAWINAADWSWDCSPEDHSDHKATSEALRQGGADEFNRVWFVTYSTKYRPVNLIGEPLERKERLWLTYKGHVAAMADAEFLRSEWENWGAKNYYRRVWAGEQDCEVC